MYCHAQLAVLQMTNVCINMQFCVHFGVDPELIKQTLNPAKNSETFAV